MTLFNKDPHLPGTCWKIDGVMWVKLAYNAQFAIAYGAWVNTVTGDILPGAVLLKL